MHPHFIPVCLLGIFFFKVVALEVNDSSNFMNCRLNGLFTEIQELELFNFFYHPRSRSIIGMTMYNQATQEIAKPSELLTSVRAYMTVLQSIENYVQIDITRVFNNVLLQQTQHLDSHGEPTITSLYTNW